MCPDREILLAFFACILPVTGVLRSQVCWVISRRSCHQKGPTWLRVCSSMKALDSPLLAEWDNPEPSVPRYFWVSRAGSPTGEIVCLGSVWGHLSKICLGFACGPQSATATVLEQCDLGDFVCTKEFAATQYLWLYRHLFNTTL